MRLLHVDDSSGELSLSLTKNLLDKDIPPYAILSHCWGPKNEEISFQDMSGAGGAAKNKSGYRKLEFCARQTAKDKLTYCWVDSCCIDQSNSPELSESINSMFRWYQRAERCYVYLQDIDDLATNPHVVSWEEAFRNSRWFTRGWTLQELIAPRSVQFFSSTGRLLGDKVSLEGQIYQRTGIAVHALQGQVPMSDFSVNDRMRWVENRTTERPEDRAYCMLGIFDVFMPPIYGEGEQNAFKRLRREINESQQSNSSGRADLVDPSETRRSIIGSLCFPEMFERETAISEAHESTFEWILSGERADHPDVEHVILSDWLRSSERMLWLSGKAGSGKSTMMKLIFRHAKFREHLDHWAPAETRIDVGFFLFDQGTSSLQRSPEGLMRSLLYQILEKRPDLVSVAFPQQWKSWTKWNKKQSSEWPWSELYSAFKRLISYCGRNSGLQIAFCVDGLDEYQRAPGLTSHDSGLDDSFESEEEDAISERRKKDLQEIAQLFAETTKTPGVKILVSSRPLEVFRHTFRNSPNIRMDAVSAGDITVLVESTLDTIDDIQHMQYQNLSFRSVLVQEIVRMADGVFLWVRLVLDGIKLRILDGDRPDEIMAELERLPRELGGRNGLYMRMIRNISPGHRQQAAKIFKLVLMARVPLSPLLLSFADKGVTATIAKPVGRLVTERISSLRAETEKRILSRCAGLLEVFNATPDSRNRPAFRIRFIHKTARDFLDKRTGWTELFGQELYYQLEHDLTLDFIIMYLHLIKLAEILPGEMSTLQILTELLHFARIAEGNTIHSVIDLLNEVDNAMSILWKGQYQYRLFPNNMWDENLTWHEWWRRSSMVGLEESKSELWHDDLMSIAVGSQLKHYFQTMLQTGKYRVKDKRGRPLLFYAVFPYRVEQADPEITKTLLDHGASPNTVFNGCTSWRLDLQWAFNSKVHQRNFALALTPVGQRWAENSRLLIEYGADPSVWLWLRLFKRSTFTLSPLYILIVLLRGDPALRRELALLLKQHGGFLYKGEKERLKSGALKTLGGYSDPPVRDGEITKSMAYSILESRVSMSDYKSQEYLERLWTLLEELGEEQEMVTAP